MSLFTIIAALSTHAWCTVIWESARRLQEDSGGGTSDHCRTLSGCKGFAVQMASSLPNLKSALAIDDQAVAPMRSCRSSLVDWMRV